MSFLDPLLGADVHADVRAALARMDVVAPTWHRARRRLCSCVHKARLAQSEERKALNLVVVGSSPKVGV
jgi:hypothetical protein